MSGATIMVDEIFGPVLQGEGPMAGRPTIFVRTGGCDFRCSWCDSVHAVDATAHSREWRRMTPAAILGAVLGLAGSQRPWVTFSGGNPAIWDLEAIIVELHEAGFRVTIETQASILPPWAHLLDWAVLSPKPPSADVATDLDMMAAWSRATSGRYGVKIVVSDAGDLDFVKDVRKLLPTPPAQLPRLYVQPCNPFHAEPSVTPEERLVLLELYQNLGQAIIDLGWHDVAVLPQLHVIANGGGRGK